MNITKFYTDFHWHQEKIIGCVINDPLAVAYMIGLCRQTAAEPTLCSGFESYVAVQTEGLGVGQTIVDGYRFLEPAGQCGGFDGHRSEGIYVIVFENDFPVLQPLD